MKRLEEEESCLESENMAEMKTFITKKSKESRNDPDNIKNKTVDLKDLRHRIKNRNFTHIT